uniref:Uncharacterized protein n=1 Tax=Siphoviridae sp. ctXPh6 TaxID=2827578 RepID=A0A8S5LJP9_9CAUD|nr:MAG TPA: hypothetical protein [Siphoviridae sp. ctXPh6]
MAGRELISAPPVSICYRLCQFLNPLYDLGRKPFRASSGECSGSENLSRFLTSIHLSSVAFQVPGMS